MPQTDQNISTKHTEHIPKTSRTDQKHKLKKYQKTSRPHQTHTKNIPAEHTNNIPKHCQQHQKHIKT